MKHLTNNNKGDPSSWREDKKDEVAFSAALREVRWNRYAPAEGGSGVKVFAKRSGKKKQWTIWESIWVPRTKSSDAKDFYDNPTVKRKAFDFDWGIAVNKHGIAKKLEREVKSMDKDEQQAK